MKFKLKTIIQASLIILVTLIILINNSLTRNLFNFNFRRAQIHSTYPNELLNNINGIFSKNSAIIIVVVLVITIIFAHFLAKVITKSLSNSISAASKMQVSYFEKPQTSIIKEVNSLNDSLQDLDIRLQIKNQKRKEIYDELYHQARTPLAVLQNQLEGMQDEVIEVNNEELQICLEQIKNITYLIDHMSSIIEAKDINLKNNITTFNLDEFILAITSNFKHQLQNSPIKLTTTACSCQITTDKNKLNQCLLNLINNAWKYTIQGEIIVSAKLVEQQIIITIQDTGKGIPADDLENIFDAYYRGKNTQEFNGDGLGLYIVKQYITQINGTINIDSTVNKGTTITIILPKEIN